MVTKVRNTPENENSIAWMNSCSYFDHLTGTMSFLDFLSVCFVSVCLVSAAAFLALSSIVTYAPASLYYLSYSSGVKAYSLTGASYFSCSPECNKCAFYG